MHRVAVLVLPPVLTFDVSVPGLILGQVRVDGAPGYEVRVCAESPGEVATEDGLRVRIAHGLRGLERADTLVVLGAGARDHDLSPALRRALRRAHDAGKRIASICTGAFALARAGLLDGRSATTYWMHSEQLRRQFPQVDVRPDVLFVEDGPIVSSAGVAAGIDLCLHLVARDFGAAAANEVARLAVVAPARGGGQAQFIRQPVPQDAQAALHCVREWARRRLHEPLTLADLAGRAHLSERTLTRRFRDETGTSPLQWLLRQRVDRARELLETTRLSMDRVAERSGLGNADAMRRHFSRRVGLAPGAYRAAFRHDRAPGANPAATRKRMAARD